MTRGTAAILIVGSGLALLFAGCGHGAAAGRPAGGQPGADKSSANITLAQGLTEGPAPVAAAWLAFAVSRAATWAQDEEAGAARKGPRTVGYALEVKSRSDLADFWKEQRGDGAAPDPYLDLLVKIREAGRMREYVLSHFSAPGWTVPAKDVAALDLPGFQRWAKGALAGRNPELLDTTRSSFTPADESKGPGVPGDDLPGVAEIGPKRVPCGRSDAALSAGLRRWEVEERALEGVPLAVTSREDLVAVLVKPPAALALPQHGFTLVSPKVGLLFFVAGFCAAEARHPDEAERHLRRAVAMDPMNVDFRGELSFALIGLKRLDEAEREVDAGLSLASDDCNRAFFWRKRGYILIDRGSLADAYRAYAESLKLDPNSDIARHEMKVIVGQIREKGGYDAKTLKNYEPPPPADEMRVKECPRK